MLLQRPNQEAKIIKSGVSGFHVHSKFIGYDCMKIHSYRFTGTPSKCVYCLSDSNNDENLKFSKSHNKFSISKEMKRT